MKSALHSIGTVATILTAGLVLPFWLPGYAHAVLGLNMSMGFWNGTASFTVMNLFYSMVPSVFNVDFNPLPPRFRS